MRALLKFLVTGLLVVAPIYLAVLLVAGATKKAPDLGFRSSPASGYASSPTRAPRSSRPPRERRTSRTTT